MVKIWDSIRHFKMHEFDSPDVPGSGIKMDTWFVFLLDHVRQEIGKPVIIISGYRTFVNNLAVGGVNDSSHLTGKAGDIEIPDSIYRLELIDIALRVGIRRIGIGKNFVHLDTDKTKPECIWVYS